MVLKVLVIFSLVAGASAQAQTKSLHLKAAQKRLLKRDYDGAEKTLARHYDLDNPKRLPLAAQNMLGLIYQQQRKFTRSSEMFHLVIARRFKRQHERTLTAQKIGALDKVNPPKTLLSVYYHLGQNYYYLYSKTKETAYFKASHTYFEIVNEKGHLDSKASRYLESLNAKMAYVKKLEKKWTWHASLGWITWQEPLDLVEKDDEDDSETLISTNSGYCAGGGFRYANVRHGFNVHGCFFSGSANIQNKAGSSVEYQQNNVSVSGAYLSSGYFYRPLDDNSSIGFSLPLFFRQGDYSDTSNRTVKGAGQLSAGLALDGEWGFTDDWSMYLNLSNLGATNLFLMQAKYSF